MATRALRDFQQSFCTIIKINNKKSTIKNKVKQWGRCYVKAKSWDFRGNWNGWERIN